MFDELFPDSLLDPGGRWAPRERRMDWGRTCGDETDPMDVTLVQGATLTWPWFESPRRRAINLLFLGFEGQTLLKAQKAAKSQRIPPPQGPKCQRESPKGKNGGPKAKMKAEKAKMKGNESPQSQKEQNQRPKGQKLKKDAATALINTLYIS